jgi:hypothetical protein
VHDEGLVGLTAPSVKLRATESVKKFRVSAPTARNVIAWGTAPVKIHEFLDALKARNTYESFENGCAYEGGNHISRLQR